MFAPYGCSSAVFVEEDDQVPLYVNPAGIMSLTLTSLTIYVPPSSSTSGAVTMIVYSKVSPAYTPAVG